MPRAFWWVLIAAAFTSPAATLPTGFAETRIMMGLSSPTAIEFAPDGRLFICQQGGQLRVFKNGALLAAPFLTVTVSSLGERGLLGVAFDPNFAVNQYVYVYYTATTPSVHNRVSRFTAAGDVAAPNSEVILFELENLSATNHNGGAIHFGPDGMLYVAAGENAVASNSQTLANRLGKILRIAPDGGIPSDNPFYGTASGVNRSIWSLGLRNPFTFAFERGTGRMFINDVGGGSWEEINEGIAGANYGWPSTEGYTINPAYRSPRYAYPHSGGAVTGCAITGGAFYDPSVVQFPSEYFGKYFFADYCGGWIRRFNPADGAVTDFASGISSPVDLKVGADGRLYYLARGSGSVYRVEFTGGQAPSISAHPSSVTAGEGQPATFTAAASGTAPLGYQWQRNGVNITGATSGSYTLGAVTATDNGAQFRTIVSNQFGSATSNAAILTVIANTAPAGVIQTPASGATYQAGQTILYSGSGTDAEDGNLSAGAFSWRIDFHHDTHTHPFLANLIGPSGAFTIPNTGEIATNVFYRIYLTVRDSGGLTHTSFRDVRPQIGAVRLLTWPQGLLISLNDQTAPAPLKIASVVGMVLKMEAPSPQVIDGRAWVFASWSDGSTAGTRFISTPAGSSLFRAKYVPAP